MALELSDAMKPVIDRLTEEHSASVLEVYEATGDVVVRLDPAAITAICSTLKEECAFTYLTDLMGTDRFTSEKRFEVIYHLISLRDRQRLFLKVELEEEEPEIDTVTGVWQNANWLEREVYDMFGVRFRNHPDLRRLYMPEDYDYFPLRKEFPLLGIPGSIELPGTTPDTE